MISHCKNCGSGVLADEDPESCNNCDPAIQAMFKDIDRIREWEEPIVRLLDTTSATPFSDAIDQVLRNHPPLSDDELDLIADGSGMEVDYNREVERLIAEGLSENEAIDRYWQERNQD